MIIKNGNVILKDKIIKADITVKNGRIEKIGQADAPDSDIIDADNCYVMPGFVDIHTHGGFGADFMDAEEDAVKSALLFHTRNGTTSLLATSVTAPVPDIEKMIAAVREYNRHADKSLCKIAGIHLEGPYLSKKNKGAQHEKYLRVPANDPYDFILNNSDIVKTVTIAPELDGAEQMVKELRKRNIVVCGGHDDGRKSLIMPVIEAGLSHCTHLWCAMSTVAMYHTTREVGLFEIGLINDGMSVELIADNHHIVPEMVQLIYRCKGSDKICLVSDSLRAGGMPDDGKLYSLGSRHDPDAQKFIISDGVAQLADKSRLAGSVQPVGQMVINVLAGGIGLVDAVKMGSLNPARVAGLDKEIGSIEVGKKADFCIGDFNLNVKTVIIDGKIVK